MTRFTSVLFSFALTLSCSAQGAAAVADSSRDRLVHLATLWGTVRYLHPYILSRGVDWDGALIRALPKVRSARTTAEYRESISSLLAELADPVTRVLEPAEPDRLAAGNRGKSTAHYRAGETLVIDFAALANLPGPGTVLGRELQAIEAELPKAASVVLDLRGGDSYWLDQYGPLLSRAPLLLPSRRFVQCSGFPAEAEGTKTYFCGFVQVAAARVQPAGKSGPGRVVFLVRGDGEGVPALAVALQAAGVGVILAEGPLAEGHAAGMTRTVELGEGLVAAVRISELISPAGTSGFRADLTIPIPAKDLPGDPALTAALAAASAPSRPAAPDAAAGDGTAGPRASFPIAIRSPSFPSVDAADHGLDARQYAVIRAWTIIHLFYPYLHLIGDWDAVLPEYLDRMTTASTPLAYARTIAAMMTHVPDGHTTVAAWEPALADQLYGETASPPLRVRRIQGVPVVTQIGPTARLANVALGDVIEEVDGKKPAERLESDRRVVTASSAEILAAKLTSILLRGPVDSTVELVLRDVRGQRKRVRLPRDPKLRAELPTGLRAGDPVQILDGGCGYVDLTRLAPIEVDAMFEKLKDTPAIIFDMRGYPNGTMLSIAPRLGTRDQPVAALFRRSLISGFSTDETAPTYTFEQRVPPAPAGKWRYTRPTVMLIDDRAISQSEHTGLFFEAANDTRFVGTPSAGTNGDVTSFTLPGSLMVLFSGHEICHADGRQLQRVGLQPDVTVAPTIAGIASGRDEVLEAAVRYLEKLHGR